MGTCRNCTVSTYLCKVCYIHLYLHNRYVSMQFYMVHMCTVFSVSLLILLFVNLLSLKNKKLSKNT